MSIDRQSSTPYYKQVKSYLLDYIKQNENNSSRLPTESEISTLLDVSKGTVKIAVKELVQEGILKRVQGKGTFINRTVRKISFASWFPQEEYTAGVLSATIDGYIKERDGITIETDSIPYEKYEHQLMLMTAAGKAPDIATLVYYWLPAFAHQGALLSLNRSEEFAGHTFEYRSAEKAASYGGERYGFTLANGPSILFFNRRILEQYCGDADPVLEEYDQLKDICAVIHKKSRGEIIPLSIPIVDDELFFIYSIYNFLLAFGGGILDEAGGVNFNSGQNIRAFSWLKEFIGRGCINTEYEFRTERQLFADGRIAFSMEAPWLKGIIPTLNPAFPLDSLGFSRLPAGPEGIRASVLFNIIVSVFRQSDEPEVAMETARHLCSDPAANAAFYTRAGLFPSDMRRVAEDSLYNDEFGRTLQKQMESAVPVPSNHPSFLMSIIFCAKAAREILLGGRAPAPALNGTAEILRELFSR